MHGVWLNLMLASRICEEIANIVEFMYSFFKPLKQFYIYTNLYSVGKTAFKLWFPLESFQDLNYCTDLKFGNSIVWMFPRFSLSQERVIELLKDGTCAVDSFWTQVCISLPLMLGGMYSLVQYVNSICLQLFPLLF